MLRAAGWATQWRRSSWRASGCRMRPTPATTSPAPRTSSAAAGASHNAANIFASVNKYFCPGRCEGMVLPLFWEITWSQGARGTLYLVGLLYSFFGISIVSDLFMGAIEKITSSTKKITLASAGDDEPEVIEVPVWNGTVANLTLMALGRFYM